MKNIINKLYILLGCLSLVACSDYLNVAPPDKYRAEDVFTDLSLTESYVNQRYTEMRDGTGGRGLRYICDESFKRDDAGSHLFNRGELNPDNIEGNTHGLWFDYFKAIRSCNLFFENIHMYVAKEEKEKNKIDRLTGEITFLRAMFYAELVNRHGGVPIITTVFGLNDDMAVKRDSYEDCIKFIVSELDKAASALPVKYDSDNWGRATKGAALALKAKILLYAASPQWNTSNDRTKWQNAADAAWAVISLKNDDGSPAYSLHPDYKNIFLTNNNSEIIYWKQYSREYGHYIDMLNAPNGYHGWCHTNVTQSMVDEYEMADGSMPTNALYQTNNPWAGREPRFYASIVYDGCTYKGREVEFFVSSSGKTETSGIDSENSSVENWNFSKTHYAMRKFIDESTNIVNQRSAQPWIYSRLGGVYLDYAEAKFQLGDEATAREYINKIRERARGGNPNTLPDITATGNALLEKLRHERKIELAFEDHRYFDVRRWKIADVTEKEPAIKIDITKDDQTGKKTYRMDVLQVRNFLPQHYLFPIPRSEIQKNPLLEQNPNYK